MIEKKEKNHPPILEEIGEYIRNPLFHEFCLELGETFQCREKIEFSSCSWERGWNIKFKKAGKTLCTIYPRELYFTVIVVVGSREREAVETILPECAPALRELYHRTREGSGQRWLAVDIEDGGGGYEDLLRLIQIRRSC